MLAADPDDHAVRHDDRQRRAGAVSYARCDEAATTTLVTVPRRVEQMTGVGQALGQPRMTEHD